MKGVLKADFIFIAQIVYSLVFITVSHFPLHISFLSKMFYTDLNTLKK